MTTPYKCAHRELMEQKLARDELVDESNKCYDCDGYNQGKGNFGPCHDYIDLPHLIGFRNFSLHGKLEVKVI